ncbi:ABC transporter ATP-binding protein [Metamycoplasma hyosynoviae]|uniref:ABC transporter ATP-binding protein n=1 Tax=Metamycoplasma hyosynoviae TaxID=29559 RepID=UPI0023613B57|nr:ABC transporter ATP-binding protein [Metamycoplasma hyosynoviae]MDD1359604.1 ABC transporter ATP-binding protein [Metamycoplasma hyosynoviae]
MAKKSKQYYCETKLFGKQLCREIVEGTSEMLSTYPDKKVLVEIRNLDITYGNALKKFYAIKNLNLNIYENEVLGLVGESGSGKSTTGRAIIGLTPHSFGYIKIQDRIIPKNMNKGLSFTKAKKDLVQFMINKVQMIFQDPTNSLNPYKNVEWIVGEGLNNAKNIKLLFQIDFNQNVFANIREKIREIDPKSKIIENLKESYKLLLSTLEISDKYIYETLYNDLKTLAIKNPKYEEIIRYIDDSKVEKDRLSTATPKEIKKMLVINMLKEVGLDESALGRFPLEFSGGQQQRLGICRSVILKPKLLIADEPISALDVSIQAQVINIFNEFKEKFNLTILFIAHDLRMVEYISDRIAVINKGTLLEVGKTEEIIHNPIHPYTKSLLDAIPSIEAKKGSLLGYQYDTALHKYDENNQPKWQKINSDHFVLASDDELELFKSIKCENHK